MEHIYYNYYNTTNLDVLINKLKSKYINYIDPTGITKIDNKKIYKSILCILQNVIRIYNKGFTEATISLDKNSFVFGPIFNGVEIKQKKLSYRYTRSFIDFLESNSYVNLNTGYKGQGVYGVIYSSPSVISFSDKLIDELGGYLLFDNWTDNITKSVIILKDSNGKALPYKTTPKIKRITEMMITYNKTFANRVSLNNETIDVFFYKVFNGSFNNGGRSYEPTIQQLSLDIRKNLIIDGEEVVELDFSAHHARILYSQDFTNLEIEFGKDFDPYDIDFTRYPKEVSRKLAKDFLNICLNTEGFEYARGAFNKKIYEDRVRLENNQPSKYGFKSIEDLEDAVPVRELYYAISDKNQTLIPHFFKSNSLRLQNIDSKITDAIVDEFNQRNEVVICIHDSYIVAKKNQQLLESIMMKAYNLVVGNNFNCKISKK